MPLSCTSSPCNPLFLNLGARCWLLYVSRASYARVQATVGVGTVLIWDIGVAYTRGGGVSVSRRATRFALSSGALHFLITGRGSELCLPPPTALRNRSSRTALHPSGTKRLNTSAPKERVFGDCVPVERYLWYCKPLTSHFPCCVLIIARFGTSMEHLCADVDGDSTVPFWGTFARTTAGGQACPQ